VVLHGSTIRAAITKPASLHTIRHRFATHRLEGGGRHLKHLPLAGARGTQDYRDLYPCRPYTSLGGVATVSPQGGRVPHSRSCPGARRAQVLAYTEPSAWVPAAHSACTEGLPNAARLSTLPRGVRGASPARWSVGLTAIFPAAIRAPRPLTAHLTLAGPIHGEAVRQVPMPALLAVRRPIPPAVPVLRREREVPRLMTAPTLVRVAHAQGAQQ
jgi:hypothetical protein